MHTTQRAPGSCLRRHRCVPTRGAWVAMKRAQTPGNTHRQGTVCARRRAPRISTRVQAARGERMSGWGKGKTHGKPDSSEAQIWAAERLSACLRPPDPGRVGIISRQGRRFEEECHLRRWSVACASGGFQHPPAWRPPGRPHGLQAKQRVPFRNARLPRSVTGDGIPPLTASAAATAHCG